MPVSTAPIAAPQTARRLETMTYEEALKGTVLIGSPGSVAERLEELRQELGLDGVLMELNCGGRIRMRT